MASKEKDVNERIESLIGLDYEAALAMLVLEQNNIFPFAGLTDKGQKAICAAFLEDLSRFDDASALANREAKRVAAEIVQIERRIADGRGRITALEEQRVELKRQQAEEQVNAQGAAERERQRAEARINEIDVEIAEKRQVLDEKAALIKEADGIIEAIEAERGAAIKGLDPFRSAVDDAQGQFTQTQADIKDLNEKMAAVHKLAMGSRCETCGSKITPANSAAYIQHLHREINTLERHDLIERGAALAEAIERDIAEEGRLVEIMVPLDCDLADHKGHREHLIKERDGLAVAVEIATLQAGRGQLTESLEPDDEAKAPDTFQKTLADLTASIKTHQAALANLENRKVWLSIMEGDLRFWVKGFGNSGVKSLVLKPLTASLTERANEWVAKVFGEGVVSIEFETQKTLKSGELRESFSVNVEMLNGGPGYLSLSGGERRAIDLCIALSLNEALRVKSESVLDILVIDEPFESLDGMASQRVAEVLRGLPDWIDIGTILVTSHHFSGPGTRARTLEVRKSGGFTRLIAEEDAR